MSIIAISSHSVYLTTLLRGFSWNFNTASIRASNKCDDICVRLYTTQHCMSRDGRVDGNGKQNVALCMLCMLTRDKNSEDYLAAP